MTVRELINNLMDSCQSLDDNVEIYVFAKTETMKEFMAQAKYCEWCLDEILQIDELEDRGGHIWLKAEEIV